MCIFFLIVLGNELKKDSPENKIKSRFENKF